MHSSSTNPTPVTQDFGDAEQIHVPEAPPVVEPDISLADALEDTPITLLGVDENLRYRWVVNPRPPWSSALMGATDERTFAPECAEALRAAKQRVLDTGRAEMLEVDATHERQRHWYEIAIRRAESGSHTALVCTAIDTSEKKRREIMLQALLREVSHRSKNLLAMVLSIASQTSRKSFDKQTFLSRFTGRMQSLARSQDAIIGSDWRGASVSELIENQIAAVIPDRRAAIRHEGPDIQLTPNAALHVGLAFHELTTNALAHGTLDPRSGFITVRVSTDPAQRNAPATLEWHETQSAAVDSASRAADSFGMTTLKRLVPAAVGGEGTVSYQSDGLRYTLTIDPSQYDDAAVR